MMNRMLVVALMFVATAAHAQVRAAGGAPRDALAKPTPHALALSPRRSAGSSQPAKSKSIVRQPVPWPAPSSQPQPTQAHAPSVAKGR